MTVNILCAGLIAVDDVFELPSFPAKGTKSRVTDACRITGGGALNAASAIAALGGRVSLAGHVGEDDLATFLLTKMAQRGINSDLVIRLPQVKTSSSAILITADGDRTILNNRDAALFPPLYEAPTPFNFDAALVDTRWPKAAAAILAAARAAGKPGVMDGEAPVAMAAEAMAVASHIVFSEQGLLDYTGTNDEKGLAIANRKLGVWCAVTRGSKSVLCHNGRHLTEVAALPSRTRNTLGAGDVWHGAFTLELAKGASEETAVQFANAAASLKVGRAVNNEALPTRDEVYLKLASASNI